MKLVVMHYLRSLRERDELDAILPDLLTENGFEVLTRPRRGTRQAGVDVAAIGPNQDNNNTKSIFLFTIKSGDLTREHWNSSQQAVRQSICDILDDYIPNRIPPQFINMPIVICICMGGEMREDIRAQWSGFCRSHEKENIKFAEWNGDRLADMILKGMLRAELMDGNNRSLLHKALAMLDQPEISYRHFNQLIKSILKDNKSEKELTRQLRKAYLCLWILFAWAREAGNIETAYRASELVLLHSWPNCDPTRINKESMKNDRLNHFEKVVFLHLIIAKHLLIDKIGPFAKKHYALSMAVNSRNTNDINISLFEILGRLCLHGLWLNSFSEISDEVLAKKYGEDADKALNIAIEMIISNPILEMPIRDDFAIEISLLMLLAASRNRISNIAQYILCLSDNLCNGLIMRQHYPTVATDYRDVLSHPSEQSDEYFKEHTRASILYILVLAWLRMLGDNKRAEQLRKYLSENAPHMTHQIWLPDSQSDTVFWYGDRSHGLSVPGLPINESLEESFKLINEAIIKHPLHSRISAFNINLGAVFLTACRHYRMPIPPHVWIAYQISSSAPDNIKHTVHDDNKESLP